MIKAVSSPETRTKRQHMGFKVTGTTRTEFANSIFIGTGARFPDRLEMAIYRVG